MLPDYRLGPEDIKIGMVGWEASEFLMDEDKDYESYRKEYLVYRHQPTSDATVGNIMKSLSPNIENCYVLEKLTHFLAHSRMRCRCYHAQLIRQAMKEPILITP